MKYVTCVKPVYAELTEGNHYKVYGESNTGIIIRNDFGLLLTYEKCYFSA